jgi:phosphate transport system permease protein
MASVAPSRWTEESTLRRVRRRFAAERRFRLLGLAAVGVSVLFLAFLLYSMAAKGLGGFVHYEAALPIDFARSNLMLDPASLRGPDAEQTVASADLESAISQAATAAYGDKAAEMFGDGAVNSLTKEILQRPQIVTGQAT